jgi:hypothetical protein
MAFTRSKISHLTWKLHEQRGRIQENMELRRKMLLDSHSQQLRNDRNSINSIYHRLQPGPRKVFLAMRLEKLNLQLR